MVKDLVYLRPYHREIARRLILCQTLIEIAAALKMTPVSITSIIKKPLFKKELKRLENQRNEGVLDVRESFNSISPVAVDTIERLMYNGSTESIKLRAAETILDRAGHGSITRGKVEIDQNIHISSSELTDRELKDLVLKRVKKIKSEETQRQMLNDEMEAITIDFECVTVEPEKNTKIAIGKLG